MPTLAGIGLLVLMLVATVLIGYCLQVGRRGSPELRKMEIEEEVGACFDVNDKQLDPMASLASLSTRPSSSCSRPNSAWSASRPQMRSPASGAHRPTSAPQDLPRSRQVRTVLEAEVLENEDFDWARPMTDLSKGRFTVEDLCTVYMNDRKRPSTSPAPYRTFQVPGLADLDMEDLKEATAAAIAAAEEQEGLQAPRPEGRSRHVEDVPYKEVWANTTQSNLLFEVWRSPDLVKEWQLPNPKLGRRKKPRLTRAWSMGSEIFAEEAKKGAGPDLEQGAEALERPDTSASSWFSDGQFIRPATLKARQPPSPPMSPPARFQTRAATAAAWMFGRREPPPAMLFEQEADLEKQKELLVSEMKEQLQHTCGEPLQVRKLIFRDLQRQLHPDKNTHCEEAAKHAFQKLMEERKSYLKP